MTTLKYKIIESFLRLTRFRNGLLKDLTNGNTRHARPKRRLAKRFQKSDFQEQAVWAIKDKYSKSDKVYVHFHGGAYVYGIQSAHYPTLAELADKSGVTVLIPDYPLPPVSAEFIHKWSANYIDAVIAEHGLENVTIGGCSAGGNLALAVLQMRQRAGQPNPAECILWSPWVDLSHPETAKPNGDNEPLIGMKGLARAAQNFAKGHDLKDPLISPVYADLNGLSEFHIFTGAKDVLHPDIRRFATKAREAELLKTYQVEPEFGHYWMFYPTKDRHRTISETSDILRGH